MFDAVDWVPTLLDASGAGGGGGSPNGLALDGVSHWHRLLNRSLAPVRNATYVNHWDNPLGGDGLRLDEGANQWKLIRGNVAFVGGDNTPDWFAAEGCAVDLAAIPPPDYPCCCAEGTEPPYDADAWHAWQKSTSSGGGGSSSSSSSSSKSSGYLNTSYSPAAWRAWREARNGASSTLPSASSAAAASCSTDGDKLDGICRPHNDMVFGGAPASDWQACCALCGSTGGCVAWTFHAGNPSPCFLKNATDTNTNADPACTSSPDGDPTDDDGGTDDGGDDDSGGGACASEKGDAASGVCRPGNDLVEGGVAADDWQACCALCGSTGGCAGWTFNAGSETGAPCFLKASLTAGVPGALCVSSPEDPPTTIMLFDLAVDPGEAADVAGLFPDVVARMVAMMDDFLLTQEPEGPPVDEACGPAVWATDPDVGDTWAPWC
jgi:hypothetical protein